MSMDLELNPEYTVLLRCNNCGAETAVSVIQGNTVPSRLQCDYCKCNRLDPNSASPLYLA